MFGEKIKPLISDKKTALESPLHLLPPSLLSQEKSYSYYWLLSPKADLWLFGIWSIMNLFFYYVISGPLSSLNLNTYEAFGFVVLLISYPHVVSTFFMVYGTQKFNGRRLLKFSPLFIFFAVAALFINERSLLLGLFGVWTFHHHNSQIYGLLRMSDAPHSQNKTDKKMTLLSPVLINLYLLSDPRGYEPPGGGSFEWLHIPEALHLVFIGAACASVLVVIANETKNLLHTKQVLLGKYLQYIVLFITWCAIPLITQDWFYVYLVGSLSHGWYYIGVTSHHFSKQDKKKWMDRGFKNYILIIILASLLLGIFYETHWAQAVSLPFKWVYIMSITLTMSHYFFDGIIWKKS